MLLEFGSSLYWTSVPFTETLKLVSIRAVGMVILQNPVLPFCPETSKLIAVPLKLKLEIVELEIVWTSWFDALKLWYVPMSG